MSEAAAAKAGGRDSRPLSHGERVGVFITCLADLFRPGIGFATVALLERAGYEVVVPEQGCCGQASFNGGDQHGARQMAQAVIELFAQYDHVVVPSGSCAAMIRVHYPELFDAGTPERAAAEGIAARTWELTAFLSDVAGIEAVDAECNATVAYHDACSALRELGVRAQPRKLLASVRGLRQESLPNADVCCGFGGTFCVKYPGISNRIVEKKLADIAATEGPVDAVVSTDLGCLLQIGGKLHREGSDIRTWHIAEVLAGHCEVAGTTAAEREAR